MSRRQVLSVGQCSMDHGSISRVLDHSFHADVTPASTHAEAIRSLRDGRFDLVLVNRVGDEDGALGLDLIRELKASPATAEVPVMLVSNYASAQAEARDLGALEGFGKSDLNRAAGIPALKRVLDGAGA